jgi:hypothetical protein
METALANHRRMHRYVMDKIKDLPGIKLWPSNDVEGEIGISLDLLLPTRDWRDQFIKAMTAENVPMSVGILGTRNLPTMGYIEGKVGPIRIGRRSLPPGKGHAVRRCVLPALGRPEEPLCQSVRRPQVDQRRSRRRRRGRHQGTHRSG